MWFAKGMLVLAALVLSVCVKAQPVSETGKLKPGFDKEEYLEVLRISALQWDTLTKTIQPPKRFKTFYRSRIVGMDNRYDLAMSPDSVLMLTIRGTTLKPVSWLENFYAAMVPAQGELTLPGNVKFPYALAADKRATVHVGWLVGMACLAQELEPQLDSLTRTGIKGLIVSGHSQGGAIACLMTAYLRGKQASGKLKNLPIKAYCSAAPKPGNLYFAYEYEAWAQQGWSYTVVNAADWVPETPLSVQSLTDFNTTNPFSILKPALRKQKFPKNLFFGVAYSRLENPPKRTVRRYQKYLGRYAGLYVRKAMPGLVTPTFSASNNYVRVGPTVVLAPDSVYRTRYPDDADEIGKVFTHHLFEPYLYLAERLPVVRP